MIQLTVSGVEKSFSVYQILNGASFEVGEHERVGLVGKNGTGKTTLLKMIMGIESKDKGDIFIRKGARLGYVEQLPKYEECVTVKEVLLMAFEKQQQVNDKMHQIEFEMASAEGKVLEQLLEEYGKLSEWFERQGGYEIETNVRRISSGLHMSDSFLKKCFMMLSGGEKTTVLLGKVLLEAPDILLLDEPTNHLDMHAMEWLENYLCTTFKGSILMVSHDRYFLDQVANKIVDLEKGVATTYKGNYSYYMKEKERLLLAEFEAYEDQQKKIKAMEKAIKRLRIWATQGDNEDLFKKAACMQKRLDKMEKIERPMLEGSQIVLRFNDSERSGKDVVKVQGVDKAFEEKQLFLGLDWVIRFGQRIALVGDNGCGKSTLIKMMLGHESQDAGEVKLGSSIKVGYLPQQVQFEDEELTVLETFKKDVVMTETMARHILAKFLFYGETVFKKVKGLSGGEKSRLMLCKLIQEDINFLILDEPTNHLDIDSRESLEEALKAFNGTLLFISHDRYFINQLAGQVSEVRNLKVIHYLGDYEYYKEKRYELFKEKIQEVEAKIIEPVKKVINGKATKSKVNPYKLSELEEEIKSLEVRYQEMTELLSEIGTDYVRAMALEEEKNQIQSQLDKTLEKWLALQEG